MNGTDLWTRYAPLSTASGRRRERWLYSPPHASSRELDLLVDTGKALDVRALKNTSLAELREYASFLATTAERIYASGLPRHEIELCPCCAAKVELSLVAMVVFNITYRRCACCGHVFVGEQPTQETLNSIFTDSANHSDTYIDPQTIEVRMTQVIRPKVDWTLENYHRLYSRTPRQVVDVGAGGGHFVEGMKRAGINAAGFEFSEVSRRHANAAFGVTLESADFLTAAPDAVDVITMWGLLEYTPEPRKFLAAARRRLRTDDGLIVVEVPRFDAVGTVAQAANPRFIARHMDPTTHVNCFPIARWRRRWSRKDFIRSQRGTLEWMLTSLSYRLPPVSTIHV